MAVTSRLCLLMMCLVIMCLALGSASWMLPATEHVASPKATAEPPGLGERSAVVIDGLRFSITSLKWEAGLLEVNYCMEFVGPRRWGFPRPWFSLDVVFWDPKGDKIDHSLSVNRIHDMGFILGKQNKDCHSFSVQTPGQARYIAVEYGTCSTLKVPMPAQPIASKE